jgi:hypothetical protein
MALIHPSIIAPDSSLWANWIDSAVGTNIYKRKQARDFYNKLINCGRVPLLSWHHIEELLGIASANNASDRINYIQELPLISWLSFDGKIGPGSVVDVLSAEAKAFDAGCLSLLEVREFARRLLLQTGPASRALGTYEWVWSAIRPFVINRRPRLGAISAFAGLNILDENQTFGHLAKQPARSTEDMQRVLSWIRARALNEARLSDPKRTKVEAEAMADNFVRETISLMPPPGTAPRQLMVDSLVNQGIEPDEITDNRKIGELLALGQFRTQLRIVAEKTGISFERLKRVKMEKLPSWCIEDALKRHGQKRTKRPGSDVHDKALASLAAYTDVIFVDRRTHEDLRRVIAKAPELAMLFGALEKVRNFEQMCE